MHSETRNLGGMVQVYVAGPYTKPYPVYNTRTAIQVASLLMFMGYAPLVPHLTMAWDLVHPFPYKCWLRLDLEHLRRCDCVLRFPGESTGADGETAMAEQWGIPVYRSFDELLTAMKPTGTPIVGEQINDLPVHAPSLDELVEALRRLDFVISEGILAHSRKLNPLTQ